MATPFIERLPHEGMSGGSQMNTDLMGPARWDLHLYQSFIRFRTWLDHSYMRNRWFARIHSGKDAAESWIVHQTDGLVHRERGRWIALHEGDIPFLHTPFAQVLRKLAPSSIRSGKHDDARSSTTQPVDGIHSGTYSFANDMEQRVFEEHRRGQYLQS